MEELALIRNPKIKVVTLENIDRDSELYIKYKQGCLEEKDLFNSCENQFVIAFYFSQISSVLKYLQFLIQKPINNQSYNVIKYYSKEADWKDIQDMFKNCRNFNSPILKALYGEVYRIKKVSFPDMKCNSVDFYDEFFFLGYVTSGSILMHNFVETFNYYINFNRNILSVLDLSNTTIISSINSNIDCCFTYLLRSKIIYKIFNSLDTEKLKNYQLYAIFNSKNITDEHVNCLLSQKLSNELITLLVALSDDFNFYSKIKTAIFDKMNKQKCKNGLDIIKLYLYHEPLSFNQDILDRFCKLNNLTKTEDYRLLSLKPDVEVSDEIIKQIIEMHKSNNQYVSVVADTNNLESSKHDEHLSFRGSVQDLTNSSNIKGIEDEFEMQFGNAYSSICKKINLFAKFVYYINQKPLDLYTILDFPEKFFSYALRLDKTEDALNLKLFNDNLLNERLKLQIYPKISRDIFCNYLIKRYKLFAVDLSDYECLMDDKYKMMYGAFNLAWAAKHIAELDKIGITDKLYRLLKNSEFKDCLVNVKNIPTVKVQSDDTSDVAKKLKLALASETNAEQEPYELKSIDNKRKEFKKKNELDYKDAEMSHSEDESIKFNHVEESQSSNYSDACNNESLLDSAATTNIHIICQNIFDRFKADNTEISDLISQVKDSSDFEYLINTIYNWTHQNRHLSDFQDLFVKYAPSFSILYRNCRQSILGLYRKYKSPKVITAVAQSAKITDILELIRDFKQIELLSKGFNFLVEKFASDSDLQNLVQQMVHSDDVPQVYIGSKAYGLLKNPKFNINHLVKYKRDDVVIEAVKQLENKKHNDLLVPVLFSRGLTDELSALICQKIDIAQLNERNLQRLYSLFYLNPLNYVKFEMFKYGFTLDDHIVLDLIKALETVYSSELFNQITSILKSYEFKTEAFNQMISLMETSNYSFKSWVLSNLSTENITLPYFVKFCLFISNEDDLDLVRAAIKVLQKGKVFDIIDKWAQMKKFDRLTRRIYPLRMTDRTFYMNLLNKYADNDEKMMLKEVYSL